MHSDLKHFLRRYVLPPAVYEALRNNRPAGDQQPHIWNGAPLSDVQFDHLFAGQAAAGVQFLTCNDEGRIALACRSRDQFEIGPFDRPQSCLQLAVAPLKPEGNVRNLTIRLNDRAVVDLRGDLPVDRWTEALVQDIDVRGVCRVSIDYQGRGPVAFANPLTRGRKRESRQNNIVVLILDSLQPPQLGCYRGMDRGDSPTPYIDSFFANHRRFEKAYSQGEWTLPSLSSMVTGLYALQHGNYNPDIGARVMSPGIPTLAETLRAEGYRTLGYSTGRRFVPSYGHYRGFDRFLYSDWNKPLVSQEIIDTAIEFMAAKPDEPFLCFLHFYDPHPPFGTLSYYSDLKSPPSRWAFPGNLHGHWKRHQEDRTLVDDLAHLSNIKTSQIDLWLNSLFAYLRDSGLDDSTTTFLLSDHGREYYKGTPLLTHDRMSVPLLVRGPGIAAGAIDDFVEPGVDLYPTILRLAGLPIPDHAVGSDLLTPEGPPREFALSESLYRGIYEIALRSRDWCYVYKCEMDPSSGEIRTHEKVGEYLYSREDDRQNRYGDTDQLPAHPAVAAEFREAMEQHCRQSPRYFDDSCLISLP